MWRLSDVVYLGLANWLATIIITSSSLFAPLRARAAVVHPKLGELVTCPLCAGVWVGFGQGVLLGGPLENFFWNGLVYKAVAELVQSVVLAIASVSRLLVVDLHSHDHQIAQENGKVDAATAR